MQTMVPLYGFGGGGGTTGAALTVTAPAGCTVTVAKDGKTKTKVADSSGAAVFKGLATGTWTLTIDNGSQTAQKPVTINADYEAAITFFSATISVTYPAGSICTATDGVTTITAPDTSGTWECVVPNAAVWTVSCTDGSRTKDKSVSITEDGQTSIVTLRYEFILFDGDGSYDGEWQGSNMWYVTTSNTKTAPSITIGDTLTASLTGTTSGGRVGIVVNTFVIPSTIQHLDIQVVSASGSTASAGVQAWAIDNLQDSFTKFAEVSAINITNDTVRLDLSSVTSQCYLAFGVYAGPKTTTTFEIQSVTGVYE